MEYDNFQKCLSMLSEARDDASRIRLITIIALAMSDSDERSGMAILRAIRDAVKSRSTRVDVAILRKVLHATSTETGYNVLKNSSLIYNFPADVFLQLFNRAMREHNRNATESFILADVLRSFLANHPKKAVVYRAPLETFIRHRQVRVRALAVECVALLNDLSKNQLRTIVRGTKSRNTIMKSCCFGALRILAHRWKRLPKGARVFLMANCKGEMRNLIHQRAERLSGPLLS